MLLDCPRRPGAYFTEHDCCSLILSTETSQKLKRCLACDHGKALAATSPFQPRRADEGDVARFRYILDYLRERFSKDDFLGLRFLEAVCKNHGLKFSARVMLLKCGLELAYKKKTPGIWIDEKYNSFVMEVA